MQPKLIYRLAERRDLTFFITETSQDLLKQADKPERDLNKGMKDSI